MADNNELTRLESYQYPSAHMGHLRTEQDKALLQFKQLCESKGYYTPRGKDGTPSHDDETMLRYLRARKFSPNDAFGQFKDTEDWRKENNLAALYETIDIEDYDAARKLYPQWTGRRDKRGIPVYVFEVAHLNHKAVSAYENSASKTQTVTSKVPPKMLRLFALYENMLTFSLPLCTALPDRPFPETPVSQSNNIVDISKVGLKQFWNLKSHMQDASQLATAHYPETLDRIFIIGAPSFFPTVWGWIKRWFDPITVSKIFILSHSDMKSTLSQYIEVENIPKKYGGTLDYEFGQLPNLDPKLQQALQWQAPALQNGKKTFPTGPIRWERAENGDLSALAVGSEKGKRRHTVVAKLKRADQAPPPGSLSDGQHAARAQLFRTTTGVDTHPEVTAADMMDGPPRSDSDAHSEVAVPQVPSKYTSAGAPAAAVPEASRAGTYTVPYREADFSSRQSQQESPREGTSSTRYAQQAQTHAHGQLAEGTPHVRDNGAGDKHSVIEPNTVGQAPKEYSTSHSEQSTPTYVDQAKDLANQAYVGASGLAGSAMQAVGLSKEGENVQEQTQRKAPEDPAVDKARDITVEEYLRSQYQSSAAGSKQ